LCWSRLPIDFLTARDAVDDRLEGFELGADDYLVKPFALEELLVRVRAVLRRAGRLGAAIEAGNVVVDEQAGLHSRRWAVWTANDARGLCRWT
jgi:two-component system OmpR family response regulator